MPEVRTKAGSMPHFEYESVSIYFEEHGSGAPLLLLAPGAMNSTIEMWTDATINPLALYQDAFRMIAMDQRNAGRSHGPLDVSDPWGAYARDQLALVDHLGIDEFHVMGCCIGGSFALRLIEHAPARVVSAVLEQPVGIADGNRQLYEEMWRAWGAQLADREDLTADTVEEFGTTMWQSDFVLSVSRDFVRSCSTPLLVLPGTDRYHPAATGREIATLAPAGRVLEPWNDSRQSVQHAALAVRQFFEAHPPSTSPHDPIGALNEALSEIIDEVQDLKQARWQVAPSAPLHPALADLFEDLKKWARLLVEQDEALGVSPLTAIPSVAGRTPPNIWPGATTAEDVRRTVREHLDRLERHVLNALAQQSEGPARTALAEVERGIANHRRLVEP